LGSAEMRLGLVRLKDMVRSCGTDPAEGAGVPEDAERRKAARGGPHYTRRVAMGWRRWRRVMGRGGLWLLALPVLAAAGAQGRPVESDPLAGTTQLLVVTTADWTATEGTLERYERATARKKWRRVGKPIPIVVGQTGLGWGLGMATMPAQGAEDPVKREGDRRAPAGIFALGTAFGYAAEEPAGWAMPYLPLTPTVECVDDEHSRFYNRVVDRAAVTPDWNSSEHMRSEGVYYEWGAVIEQNPGATPGAGSCVFLHIRGEGDGGGTVGCTAMAKPLLEDVLGWLRPSAHPALAQMPVGAYRRMERALGLPPR
jgi:zinc D-Ala-D-Ala dipeptidase